MSSYATIIIGNVTLPVPSDIKVTFEDLDSEELKRYLTTGKMRRKRIRAEVLKLEVTYNLTDVDNIYTVLEAIRPQTYTAKLYLPDEKIYGTLEMYSNEKTFNYVRVKTGLKAQPFTFTMTEV